MTEISMRNENFRTTILALHKHSIDSSKFKFISPEVTYFLLKKWKNLMLKSLALVSEFNYADNDLIHDLNIVISKISEDKFIQAILSFQPFKPKFRATKFLDLEVSSTRLASTATNEDSVYQSPRTKLKKCDSIIEKGSLIIKKKTEVNREPKTCETIKEIRIHQRESFLKEYLEVIIQEESLKKEFEKKYHPFKKIIDSFVFILENKFKNIIDSAPQISLEKIQELITYDVLVIEKLFIKISDPYMTIFDSENPEEVKCFRNKMNSFIKEYIHKHEKINSAVRKVMRHYSRNSLTVGKIQKSIEDFVEVEKFNIPLDFKIDGCYVQSMNSLMEFAETIDADESLKKLKEFRSAIAKDVDYYYESINQTKEREINAEVQIEIVRFVLCKLKGWIPEIFSQLKFLEVVFGDEDMAFRYDDASYIYAQLITVFDALEIEAEEKESIKEKEQEITDELNN